MRVTIKATLIGIAALMTLLAVGQGAVSILKLRDINAGVVSVGEKRLPAVRLSGEIGNATASFRLAEALLLIALNDTTKQQALGDAEAARGRVNATLADMKARFGDDFAQDLDTFATDWTAYMKAHDDFVALSNSGNFSLATDAFIDDLQKRYDALNATLARLGDRVKASAEATSAATRAGFDQALMISGGMIVFLVLIGLVVIGYVIHGITRPLTRLTLMMRQMAAGDLERDVPSRKRQDEIGAMAAAVGVFKSGLVEAAALRDAQVMREQSARDELARERRRIADDFSTQMGQHVTDFGALSSSLAKAAQGLAATAETAVRRVDSVLGSADSASANVQTIAAATEQLAASVHEIGGTTGNLAQISSTAAREAGEADRAVLKLSEAAGQIGDVLKLISAVASQTDLLALNATIEAARAGEAGKGFAVVATEVKGLAAQSARATEEIGHKIHEIQSLTRAAVERIGAIVSTLDTIRNVSSSIASSVDQQGAATSEIAANAHRAADGTHEVSNTMGEVDRSARQVDASASELQSMAETLGAKSKMLSSEVNQFVSRLRSA